MSDEVVDPVAQTQETYTSAGSAAVPCATAAGLAEGGRQPRKSKPDAPVQSAGRAALQRASAATHSAAIAAQHPLEDGAAPSAASNKVPRHQTPVRQSQRQWLEEKIASVTGICVAASCEPCSDPARERVQTPSDQGGLPGPAAAAAAAAAQSPPAAAPADTSSITISVSAVCGNNAPSSMNPETEDALKVLLWNAVKVCGAGFWDAGLISGIPELFTPGLLNAFSNTCT